MPKSEHEGLVGLFRNRPELAPELLRDALGVTLPAYAEARIEDANLTEREPTEYRADLVVLLVDGKPVLAIVVEVQRSRDRQKAFTWPVYVTGVRARFKCPACVLVVATSERVASWARTPVALGPGSVVTPLVVGPRAIPIVRDAEVARRDPELAVLSVVAHGRGEEGLAVATAAFRACERLDTERALLYLDLIGSSLNDIARAAFEDLMANNYEFQTDFAKKYSEKLVADSAKARTEGLAKGLAKGLAEGRTEGLAEGRTEGLAEGRTEGLAKGRAEERAKSILAVLEARGIKIGAGQQQRVLACADLETLGRWIRSAATVAAADELFLD